MRPGCWECVEKHMAAAAVADARIALNPQGSRLHVVGNLVHAAEECAEYHPDLANVIQAHRTVWSETGTYAPLHKIPYEDFQAYITTCIAANASEQPYPEIPEELKLLRPSVDIVASEPKFLEVEAYMAAAAVANSEIELGYPDFRMYVIGNLVRASEVCMSEHPWLGRLIRDHRIAWSDTTAKHDIPYEGFNDFILKCLVASSNYHDLPAIPDTLRLEDWPGFADARERAKADEPKGAAPRVDKPSSSEDNLMPWERPVGHPIYPTERSTPIKYG